MTKHKTLTNKTIYALGLSLNSLTQELEDFYLPVKVGFYLQKNISTILTLAREIEEERTKIISKYGTLQEDGSYNIPQEKISLTNEELEDLLSLDQEVTLNTIPLESFKDTTLTIKQIDTLSFMIEESQEEDS